VRMGAMGRALVVSPSRAEAEVLAEPAGAGHTATWDGAADTGARLIADEPPASSTRPGCPTPDCAMASPCPGEAYAYSGETSW
jgi:hypothetical protein